MKKLLATLQGKLENRRAENKVKRVEAALDLAALNFKTQKDDNECKLEELIEQFNDSDKDVEFVIQEISDTITNIEEAEEGLKKVKKIREFLFEEVTI